MKEYDKLKGLKIKLVGFNLDKNEQEKLAEHIVNEICDKDKTTEVDKNTNE